MVLLDFTDYDPERLAKVNNDKDFYIKFGLCSQFFNTVPDSVFRKFIENYNVYHNSLARVRAAIDYKKAKAEEVHQQCQSIMNTINGLRTQLDAARQNRI